MARFSRAAQIAYEEEIKKLEKEKKTLHAKLLVAQKEVEGSEMQLREARQRNKDLNEELRRAKDMWELANSKLISKLNKAKKELRRA